MATEIHCLKCKAPCCREMWFQLDPNKYMEHAKWVRYHGIEVREHNNYEYAILPIRCKRLKRNKCTVYEDRPQMCRDFTCDGWGLK
jgi:Fe-S-cluster containining protein